MRKILILGGATTQVYAPITGALTTKDAALDPSLLAVGALGIYGLVEEDASNVSGALGMQALITEATDSTTGKMQDSTFVAGSEIVSIYQGGNPSGYPVGVQGIQRRGVSKIVKQIYVAPVKQVSFIGYNGTTGSLSMPTVVANDDAALIAVQKEATTLDQIREQENYSTGGLLASTAAYDVILPIVNAVNNTPTLSRTHVAEIVANSTTITAMATATALKFVKGSTTVYAMIEDATEGWVASTTSVAAGDLINVPHANMTSVTFSMHANENTVTIGATSYVGTDGATAEANAIEMVALINAGTQATATNAVADITIVMLPGTAAKITAMYDSATNLAPTVNATTGDTVPAKYKAAAATTAAATFELDHAYTGETMITRDGTTETLYTGVATVTTEYGIKMTVIGTSGESYSYAKQGVLQYATLTYSVNASKGFGAGANIVKLEEQYMAYRGQNDTYSKWAKQLPRFADATKTYSCYTIIFTQTTETTGAPHNKSANSAIEIYVPSGQATLITSIEALLGTLFTSALKVGF